MKLKWGTLTLDSDIVCVTVSLSVFMYRRILLSAEPISFWCPTLLLMGPGMNFIYFGEGNTTLPREMDPWKKTPPAPTLIVPKGLKGEATIIYFKVTERLSVCLLFRKSVNCWIYMVQFYNVTYLLIDQGYVAMFGEVCAIHPGEIS